MDQNGCKYSSHSICILSSKVGESTLPRNISEAQHIAVYNFMSSTSQICHLGITGERTVSFSQVSLQCSITEKEKEFGCWGRQLADAATLENMKILMLQNTSKFQVKYNKCTLKIHFWDFHFLPRWSNRNQIYPSTQNNKKTKQTPEKCMNQWFHRH